MLCGSPDALDRLGVHHDALTVRIAPDELLVVHVVHVVATVQGLDEIEAELGNSIHRPSRSINRVHSPSSPFPARWTKLLRA